MDMRGPELANGVARLALAFAMATSASPSPAVGQTRSSPEARAVAFLSREVPSWPRENHCFSCHNNGDAARALYDATRRGEGVPDRALLETTRWLGDPDGWDRNGGDGPFSDKQLARVQFSTALAAAHRAGRANDPRALLRAGSRLARDQASDGSWPLEGENEPGSPATYGRLLATYLARDSLQAFGEGAFRDAIRRADRWILAHKVESVIDAAVMLLATSSEDSPQALAARVRSLELLKDSQSGDGGWGPYVKSPPEVFDTALVLLALAKARERGSPEIRARVLRGRGFLIAEQQGDGGWIETTRPRGAESYAQRISTSGWATLALLATREPASPARGGGGTDPELQADDLRSHP